MNREYQAVKRFHLAMGHPAPTLVTQLTRKRVLTRAKWLMEEVQELKDGITQEEQIDACIDIIYLATGTMVEMGLNPTDYFDNVQMANMDKVWEDGKVHLDDSGKVIKPPHWIPPKQHHLYQLRMDTVRARNDDLIEKSMPKGKVVKGDKK